MMQTLVLVLGDMRFLNVDVRTKVLAYGSVPTVAFSGVEAEDIVRPLPDVFVERSLQSATSVGDRS